MTTYQMENIRNVAVTGHGKSGKSSIIEAMLFNSGAINRMGKNLDGTAPPENGGLRIWAEEKQERLR